MVEHIRGNYALLHLYASCSVDILSINIGLLASCGPGFAKSWVYEKRIVGEIKTYYSEWLHKATATNM